MQTGTYIMFYHLFRAQCLKTQISSFYLMCLKKQVVLLWLYPYQTVGRCLMSPSHAQQFKIFSPVFLTDLIGKKLLALFHQCKEFQDRNSRIMGIKICPFRINIDHRAKGFLYDTTILFIIYIWI